MGKDLIDALINAENHLGHIILTFKLLPGSFMILKALVCWVCNWYAMVLIKCQIYEIHKIISVQIERKRKLFLTPYLDSSSYIYFGLREMLGPGSQSHGPVSSYTLD